MEAWTAKNGGIGVNTIGSHNYFGGTPVWENLYTELLQQKVYEYGVLQKLKANTWYTLSFWGAMQSYQDLLSSSVYNGSDGGSYWQIGASRRGFWLSAGQQAIVTVTGRCYSSNVYLKVFGFEENWESVLTSSVTFTSTSSQTKSFLVKNTSSANKYFYVEGYVYLSSDDSQNTYTDLNHRCYITLIRVDRGCKMASYLYRSDGGQAVQHSSSAPWYVDGKKYTAGTVIPNPTGGRNVTLYDGTTANVQNGTHVGFADDGNIYWQLNPGHYRHSVTFKTPSSLSTSAQYKVLFRLVSYSHYGWISMPKLEENTIATDWIENTNDRMADDIQHVYDGPWESGKTYFYGGGTGVRHVVRAKESVSGAMTYWRMKQRTTSSGYTSTTQPYNDTSHWEKASYLKFLASDFALIENAIINFQQTNRILVYNSAGNVAAGMGGAEGGSNDYPLWVGADYANRATAPFRVTLLGKMYASGCVISGDSIFEGTLRGVTGSFKSLNCVNESGTITGAIRFGSDGNLWLEGDLFANGTKDNRSYRFYTADIWCRGHFASRQRLTLVVCGSYGYYFPKGLPSTWDVSNAVYVSFSSVTSGGQTYYRIPCYSPDGYSALAGMPVDTVLFRITLNTTYRYYFGLAVSQRIVVANINDEQNNVIICCNGRDITWNGGEINFVQNMGYGMIYPAKASNVIGGGHVVGAFRDNDWR